MTTGLAVLHSETTFTTCYCTLSAPHDLHARVKALKVGGKDAMSVYDPIQSRPQYNVKAVEFHHLLNWIEASGWKLEHVAAGAGTGNNSKYETYVFRKS